MSRLDDLDYGDSAFDDLDAPSGGLRGRLGRLRPSGGGSGSGGPSLSERLRSLNTSDGLRGLTRHAPEPDDDPYQMRPTRTAFDLLEGGFAAARNTRRLNIALVLVVIVAVFYMGGVTIVNYVGQGSLDASVQTNQSTVNTLNTQIAKSLNGFVTPQQVTDHHTARVATISNIQKLSLDYATLIQSFESAAPGGVITALAVAAPAAPASGSGSGSSSPTTTVPSGFTVTVTYSLPSASDILTVQNNINNLGFVERGSTSFSGSIGATPGGQTGPATVTFTTTLSPSGITLNRIGGL